MKPSISGNCNPGMVFPSDPRLNSDGTLKLGEYDSFELARQAIARQLAARALESGTGKLEYQVGYYEALADVILMDNPHVTKVPGAEYHTISMAEMPSSTHRGITADTVTGPVVSSFLKGFGE